MVKKRIALVRESDGVVLNVCVWDGVSPWNDFPASVKEIECPDEVGPGHLYVMGEWIAPPPPSQQEQADEQSAEG